MYFFKKLNQTHPKSFPQNLVMGAFLKILPSGHCWKDILDLGPNFENFIILKKFGHAGQEIKFKGLLSLWMILGFQALISKRTISWRRLLIFCDQWKCNWALRPKVFLFLFSFFFLVKTFESWKAQDLIVWKKNFGAWGLRINVFWELVCFDVSHLVPNICR